MPDPAISATTGDAFEQGQAAMEANGSWLVPTFEAAGIDFGIAPLPEGARRAGSPPSTRPGAVVYKGSKSPDAAWEFVKYLASPAAQEQLMQLKASLPVNKEVLAGPYADVVRRGAGLRRQPRVRQAQAVVQGLRRVHDDAPGQSSTRTSSTPPTRRPRTRSRPWCPELDALLAGQLGPTDGPRRPASAPPLPRRRRGPRSGEGWWALLFLAPTLIGLDAAVGRADRRLVRDQPDQLGPAAAAAVRGPRQLRRTSPATPGSSSRSGTRRSTCCCRCRSGWCWRWASRSRSTSPCGGSRSSGPRTSCRSSPRRPPSASSGRGSTARTTACSTSSSACSGCRPRSGSATRSGRCRRSSR